MNKVISIILGVIFLTYSTFLFAATDYSSIAIPFDGRNWNVGHRDANEYQKTTEYVPDGQTVEQWLELVTVSEFFGIQDKITAEEMMNSMMQLAQENCKGVKKNVLQSLTDGILFEWETAGCEANIPGGQAPEFDISRIIFTKDRVFMMQYASKTRPTAEKRTEWIKIITSSIFTSTENYEQLKNDLTTQSKP